MLSASRPNCPASSQQGPMSCRHTPTQPHLEAWRLPKKLADFQTRVRDCVELYVPSLCTVKMSRSTWQAPRIAHVNICPNSCSRNRNGKTSFRVTCSRTWRVLLQPPSQSLLAATYTMLPALVTCSPMSFTPPSKLLCTLACDARHSAYVMWNTDVRYMPLPNCNGIYEDHAVEMVAVSSRHLLLG
jgi:hypothetical protein